MSRENALRFIDDYVQDPALRAKVRHLGPNEVDSLVDIALLEGYEFSRDDYLAALRSAKNRQPAGGGMGALGRLPGFNLA